MQSMKWWVVGGPVGLLVLFGSLSCGHEAGVQTSSPSFSEEHGLPFERVSAKGGMSPTSSIPYSEIPAGTVVTIRIQSQLSSMHSRPGDPFQAVLDFPVQIDGVTVAPRDSVVGGRVLEAKAASAGSEFGYLRLELTSITLRGKLLPLQTVGIFVKGSAPDAQPRAAIHKTAGGTPVVRQDVEFPAARLLAFRLSQPVVLQN